MDKNLINKHLYKKLVKPATNKSELQQLAELTLELDETSEVTVDDIRFGQGELYFHHKDFETAIFKWEKVTGEKVPWAQKNIADAYDAQGLIKEAKKMYQSIKSTDEMLKTEVYLQLFSIHMEEEKLDDAAKIIKDAVDLNPDYPNVTEIARAFFEQYRDYSSAIELAVNEAIRTESMQWFDKVSDYVKQNLTTTTSPAYFMSLLTKLAVLDQRKYEQLVTTFWSSYQGEELYFDWLVEFNDSFAKYEERSEKNWPLLSKKYEETYFELISGTYFIREIESIIPVHMRNWFELSKKANDLLSTTAILAWNELFPGQLEEAITYQAKEKMESLPVQSDSLESSLMLFQEISNWAKKHELEVGQRLRWLMQQLLDFDKKHVLIAGASVGAKKSFLDDVVGETNIPEQHSSFIFLKDGAEEIIEIDEAKDQIDEEEVSEVEEVFTLERQENNEGFSMLEVKWPSPFLSESELVLIDTPIASRKDVDNQQWLPYLPVADCFVFVLNGNHPFTDHEREFLLKMKSQFPEMPLHFIFNKMDGIYSEFEEERILTETKSRVKYYFPNAQLHSFTPQTNTRNVADFFLTITDVELLEKQRNEKILYFIRETIKHLFEQRAEMEKEHLHSVTWNEDMVEKLKAAVHQLNDLEKEESALIKDSYQNIRKEMKEDIEKAIPEIIRECSSYVKENSDFKALPAHLNEEINSKIQTYLDRTIMPKFANAFQRWLETSNVAFIRSQSYLKEMADGFNKLYQHERFKMDGDFRILDDWHRDVERMSAGVAIEPINIFNRMSPSQLVLKSSGKLFGALPNKSMLYKMYMKFFSSEDFSPIARHISTQFLMQFELFERGLQRDVQMFFKHPFNILNGAVKDAESEIETNNEAIGTLKSAPEVYRDPLTLFQVRVRQYEWMTSDKRALEMRV
ncbi:GTP-binding protein [Alkalihalobacillus sp. 1P02AB]|uniref:GTP-binding protein n=1 Tax=Alkalihalobacillus sp. 1P02AB TaxID=3132260 RepID=UPI0039A4A8FA